MNPVQELHIPNWNGNEAKVRYMSGFMLSGVFIFLCAGERVNEDILGIREKICQKSW